MLLCCYSSFCALPNHKYLVNWKTRDVFVAGYPGVMILTPFLVNAAMLCLHWVWMASTQETYVYSLVVLSGSGLLIMTERTSLANQLKHLTHRVMCVKGFAQLFLKRATIKL